MDRLLKKLVSLLTTAAIALSGCNLPRQSAVVYEDRDGASIYDSTGLSIEEPAVESEDAFGVAATQSPMTISESEPSEYWDLRLEEAVQLALSNAKILRDLGGLVLKSPVSSRSIHDPAIVETDPRFGVDAALSAFDATFAASAFFEKNDRALNNVFFGGGTRILQQDGHVYQTQLTKRTAVGTELTLRNNTDYDSNNAPGNQFFSAWNTNIEMLVRQPLLQGGGLDFNRIYGPNGIPGLPSGVLLARMNTDISLADFEIGVRNFLSDVENAYWDLYFAYRDLDAKLAARDAALETWRKVKAQNEAGRLGGEAQQEAQAREQYYRFQEEVQNAQTGKFIDRTSTGGPAGTFRGQGGVQASERRLRLMMGMSISDGRLIRPADEPKASRAEFAWDVVLAESLTRRSELRRQKWIIKRREMELLASQNLLLPRLDAIGRYRWRGFGKDLLTYTDDRNLGQFSNAWENLLGGNFQEWQLGFEFAVPLGFRKGHVAVRNAELQLARERAVLNEQERDVVFDLSNAFAEVKRAQAAAETNYNRRSAAKQQLAAIQAIDDQRPQTLYLELDAQRRLADSETQYYRSLVEYELAVKHVHFEKGSLLDYNGVFLSELAWPAKAYEDAYAKVKLRTRAEYVDSFVDLHEVVSDGPAVRNIVPSSTKPASATGASVPEPAAPTPPVEYDQ